VHTVARGCRPSLTRPGQHDHLVRLLRQRPAVESAADLVPREARGAQQQLHLGTDHEAIGDLLAEMNRPSESVRSYQKAEAIMEQVVA